MHPDALRTRHAYSPYSRSSRLDRRAPHPSRSDAAIPPRPHPTVAEPRGSSGGSSRRCRTRRRSGTRRTRSGGRPAEAGLQLQLERRPGRPPESRCQRCNCPGCHRRRSIRRSRCLPRAATERTPSGSSRRGLQRSCRSATRWPFGGIVGGDGELGRRREGHLEADEVSQPAGRIAPGDHRCRRQDRGSGRRPGPTAWGARLAIRTAPGARSTWVEAMMSRRRPHRPMPASGPAPPGDGRCRCPAPTRPVPTPTSRRRSRSPWPTGRSSPARAAVRRGGAGDRSRSHPAPGAAPRSARGGPAALRRRPRPRPATAWRYR